ncbi:MAG: T9SS type A sorting domain-containing protein [Crocinitomicaceae bacterium]|nr:T9SS type A sorting domain-containing protein [Crocinitomicaceae bacterium]
MLIRNFELNYFQFLPLFLALFLTPLNPLLSQFEIAADNAGNYGGAWNSNQGVGFNNWSYINNGGSGGFAGRFIGNPGSADITGMNTNSFGLFANPNVVGNESKARRTFSGGQLQFGDVFEFQMGMNWDAGNGDGFKGIDILNSTGNVILNFNMGNSATITWGSPTGGSNGTLFSAYGTQAMSFQIARTGSNQYRVIATPRAGGANFNQIINLGGEVAGFEFYAGRLNSGDQRQPYYNNLAITNSGIFDIVSGTETYSRALTGSGNLSKLGAGILVLTGNSNYNGTTTITAGELRLNPTVNATPASQFVLNGGTLSTAGIAVNRTITSSNTLRLDASSTINLGNVNHGISFSASNAVAWNSAAELTITGWTGTAGTSGTNGKIFVGSNTSGLTAAQLDRISFQGFPGKAMLLATGEIVPRQLQFRSVQIGNWNQTSTWEVSLNGGITWQNATSTPSHLDDIITIRNTHTVNITAAVTIDQVVVDPGATIVHSGNATITLANGVGTDLIILGTWRRTIATATISISTGATMRVENGGVYEQAFNGDGGSIPTATWEENSILRLMNTSTGAGNYSNMEQSFGIVEYNRPNQTSALQILQWASIDFDIRNEFRVISTGSGAINLNSSWSISGNYNQTNGNVRVNTTTTSRNFTIGGDFYLNGGVFNVSAGNSNTNVVIDGNLNMSGGSFYLKGGTAGGTQSLRVKGDFLHSGGGFNWNNSSSDNTSITAVYIEKDFIISGSASWGGFVSATQCASGVFFDGNGIQLFSSNLSHASATGVSQRFYYKTTGGPTALNESYTGSVEQWTVNGTCGSVPPSGYARWPTSGAMLQNFTVNNSSSQGVNLRDMRMVNGSLHLINGKLNSGACNASTTSATLLTLADNATTIGASSDSYVNGVMQKLGDDPFVFPIGNATSYHPVAISAPTVTTDRFGACFLETDPTVAGFDRNSKEVSIANVADCHFWHLNRISGSSDVTVGLNVDCPSLLAADEIVVRWDGSEWKNEGGTFAAGVVTSDLVNSFSPFTTGNDINAVLPVTLSFFNITCEDEVHQINWQTESELNNHYFLIEQSLDGENWREITKVFGAGTTSFSQFYAYSVSNVSAGTVYYRLKQFDFDGTMDELGVRAASCNDQGIRLFPNPSKQDLFLSGLEKGSSVSLYDMTGKLVKSVIADNSNFYWNISELQAGMYQVLIKTSTENKRMPFVKL